MRFAFTEEQELMRSSFRELLVAACPPAVVRACFMNGADDAPTLEGRLAEFGAFGVAIPEESGGLGLGAVELALLLEESGRAAVPEPFLDIAVAASLLVHFATDDRAATLLTGLTSGEKSAAVLWESRLHVPHADRCAALLVERGDELHLVPRASLDLVPETSVDRTRRLFRVDCRTDGTTRLAGGPDATRLLADAFDLAALGSAAELVGLGRRVLEMAIEYAKTRSQFGQPIGAFQAVKHLLADAHLGLAFAHPLVYRAAYSVAGEDPERSLHVSSAKAFASDAATRAARTALQVHGAIGYSYEHDLHLWMKRIWALSADHGDAEAHRERIAQRVLD